MRVINHIVAVVLVFATFASSIAAPLPDTAAANAGVLDRLDLTDHRGRQWSLDEFSDKSLIVIAFLGTECPLAKLYSIRLSEISKSYAARGVAVLGVMSNRQDSLVEIEAFASRQAVSFPVLKDVGNRFADQLGAERTPEVYVFDSKRRLRYRGRVDDQYGIGFVREEPSRNDLNIAIDELLSGRDVSISRTSGVGCIIGRNKAVDENTDITYGSHIAGLLNKHCVECHRAGEIAPFALTDAEDAIGWSEMIAEVIREGRMPPWHATDDHAEFANDRRLSDEDKQSFYKWSEAGAPIGDTSHLPSPPAKIEGWQLPRDPDRVIEISPQPIEVPAVGTVRYKYFTVDPGFDEDVWIEAAELQPGNREIVHHILAFAVPKGQHKGLDGARGFLVGYVPGARLELAPPGHAKKIPAGSQFIFQVHYTPIGTAQTDQSRLGIVLADPAKITHEIFTSSAVNTSLRIPPGDANYQVTAISPPFPKSATLLSFSPHMHVRGKSYRYEIKSDNDSQRTLLDIPAYDFNWQTTYVLREPLAIQNRDRLFCTATFDNSAENLNNPDPTATVTWGDQTWDEMMIGYYHYSVPLQSPSANDRKETAAEIVRRTIRLNKFDELDQDGDERVLRHETPRSLHAIFDELDTDNDQVLTRTEAYR